MDREEPAYHLFLLRLWPVASGDDVRWRASIQNASSGERQGFEDLEALFAYLRDLARGVEGLRGERSE